MHDLRENFRTLEEWSKCTYMVVQKLMKCSMTTLATVITYINGDQTVTMFSGIIEDLTKNVKGASLTGQHLTSLCYPQGCSIYNNSVSFNTLGHNY